VWDNSTLLSRFLSNFAFTFLQCFHVVLQLEIECVFPCCALLWNGYAAVNFACFCVCVWTLGCNSYWRQTSRLQNCHRGCEWSGVCTILLILWYLRKSPCRNSNAEIECVTQNLAGVMLRCMTTTAIAMTQLIYIITCVCRNIPILRARRTQLKWTGKATR